MKSPIKYYDLNLMIFSYNFASLIFTDCITNGQNFISFFLNEQSIDANE